MPVSASVSTGKLMTSGMCAERMRNMCGFQTTYLISDYILVGYFDVRFDSFLLIIRRNMLPLTPTYTRNANNLYKITYHPYIYEISCKLQWYIPILTETLTPQAISYSRHIKARLRDLILGSKTSILFLRCFYACKDIPYQEWEFKEFYSRIYQHHIIYSICIFVLWYHLFIFNIAFLNWMY